MVVARVCCEGWYQLRKGVLLHDTYVPHRRLPLMYCYFRLVRAPRGVYKTCFCEKAFLLVVTGRSCLTGTSSRKPRKWALSSFSRTTAPAPRHARSELGRGPEALSMDVLSGIRELLAASEQYGHHSRRRHSGVLWVAVHIGTCGLSRPLAGRASFVLG